MDIGLSLILGFIAGFIPGLTGAGGSILATPLLIAAFGWSMSQAIPVALLSIAASAAIGSLEGFHKKLVRYRAAILIVFFAIPFTWLGTKASHILPQSHLLQLFAIVMILVALNLWYQTYFQTQSPTQFLRIAQMDPDTGRLDWNWATAILLAAIGIVTGFITGLLGVGGGFVVVPLFKRFTHLTIHGIVATSLFIVALVSLISVAIILFHGISLPTSITLSFALATITGMLSARALVTRLSANHVQYGFAGILILIAIWMLANSFKS